MPRPGRRWPGWVAPVAGRRGLSRVLRHASAWRWAAHAGADRPGARSLAHGPSAAELRAPAATPAPHGRVPPGAAPSVDGASARAAAGAGGRAAAGPRAIRGRCGCNSPGRRSWSRHWIATVGLSVVAFAEGGSAAVRSPCWRAPSRASWSAGGRGAGRPVPAAAVPDRGGAALRTGTAGAVFAGSLIAAIALITVVALVTMLFRTAQSAILPELVEDLGRAHRRHVLRAPSRPSCCSPRPGADRRPAERSRVPSCRGAAGRTCSSQSGAAGAPAAGPPDGARRRGRGVGGAHPGPAPEVRAADSCSCSARADRAVRRLSGALSGPRRRLAGPRCECGRAADRRRSAWAGCSGPSACSRSPGRGVSGCSTLVARGSGRCRCWYAAGAGARCRPPAAGGGRRRQRALRRHERDAAPARRARPAARPGARRGGDRRRVGRRGAVVARCWTAWSRYRPRRSR